MHRDDRAFRQHGEARAEGGFELRCQVDFRHQHQRLRIGPRGQQVRQRMQIHLGLAAAGHAVQQERRERVAHRGSRGRLSRCSSVRCGSAAPWVNALCCTSAARRSRFPAPRAPARPTLPPAMRQVASGFRVEGAGIGGGERGLRSRAHPPADATPLHAPATRPARLARPAGSKLISLLRRKQAGPSRGVAQHLRQRRQGDFTESALVILGGKRGQRQPFGDSGGQASQIPRPHASLSAGTSLCAVTSQIKPDDIATSERHAHQHAGHGVAAQRRNNRTASAADDPAPRGRRRALMRTGDGRPRGTIRRVAHETRLRTR